MTTAEHHDAYVKHLRDLISALEEQAELEQKFDTGDFASEVSALSTQQELNAAKNLLKNAVLAQSVAHQKDDLHVFLRQEQDPHGPVPLDTLGKFLHSFQMLSNSLHQATEGLATSRGRVQHEILLDAQLYAVAGIQGSFGVRLRTAPRRQQLLAQGKDSDNLQHLLTDLLDGSLFDRDAVVQICSASPRVFKNYRDILSLISKSRLEVTAAARGKLLAASMTSDQASSREMALLNLDVSTVTTEMHGKLVGASLVKDRFEFESKDGLVSGTTPQHVADKIATNNLFGKRVIALIQETIETQAEDLAEPRSRYELLDVWLPDSTGPSLFGH